PLALLGVTAGTGPGGQMVERQQAGGTGAPIEDEMGQFVSVVLASTEDTWSAVFAQAGARYRAPRLVLYTGSTPTACGMGSAASGPFYCRADESAYVDLGFYQMLRQRFGPSDYPAAADVVAYEVGHHVPNRLGDQQQ